MLSANIFWIWQKWQVEIYTICIFDFPSQIVQNNVQNVYNPPHKPYISIGSRHFLHFFRHFSATCKIYDLLYWLYQLYRTESFFNAKNKCSLLKINNKKTIQKHLENTVKNVENGCFSKNRLTKNLYYF